MGKINFTPSGETLLLIEKLKKRWGKSSNTEVLAHFLRLVSSNDPKAQEEIRAIIGDERA